MSEIELAIAHIERMQAHGMEAVDGGMFEQKMLDNIAESIVMMEIALTALRDMLKRREGCDFCNESEQIQNQYGDIMGMDEGVLILDTEGYPGVTFRIKYCPDCGRELSGNSDRD